MIVEFSKCSRCSLEEGDGCCNLTTLLLLLVGLNPSSFLLGAPLSKVLLLGEPFSLELLVERLEFSSSLSTGIIENMECLLLKYFNREDS